MYEQRNERLITRRSFAIRVLCHLLLAVSLICTGLGIGVLGYHYLCGLGWLDSLLNASMILGGMGPVDPLVGPSAKIFASFYALFSGIVLWHCSLALFSGIVLWHCSLALFSGIAFVGVASLIVAPFAHRLLHRVHLDEE